MTRRDRELAEHVRRVTQSEVLATLVRHGILPSRVLEENECDEAAANEDESMDPMRSRMGDGGLSSSRQQARELVASLRQKERRRFSGRQQRPSSKRRRSP